VSGNHHYSAEEAAELSGLALGTIRKYCRGYSDLVRGKDFYVHRFGPARRKLYLTERGLFRLTARAYRSYPSGGGLSGYRPSSLDFEDLPERYDGFSVEEFTQRWRQMIQLITQRYQEHPCAVPQCPCMVHRLGLPQADVIAAERAALAERKAARKAQRG
jgi:hypothetical protein